MSTGAMAACCAHHLADLLPFLGLSAAAVFLSRYQVPFILIGLASNVIGILTLIARMKETGTISGFKLPDAVSRGQGSAPENTVSTDREEKPAAGGQDFTEQTDTQGGVTVSVRPVGYREGFPIEFEIGFNTHQGDLAFEVTEKATMSDDLGNTYLPLDWTGSVPGGDHRSGTLVFPPVTESAEEIALVIHDVYGIPVRQFVWDLVRNATDE